MTSQAFITPLPLAHPSPFTSQTSLSPSTPLSRPHFHLAPTCSAKPVHVGVAGAGIAGLTTALALLRTPGTGVKRVTLFEPRSAVDPLAGAALNMNSGAAVLARAYGLGEALRGIGNPVRRVVAKVADGSVEGGAGIYEVDVGEVVKKGAASKTLVQDGELMVLTMMRAELEALLVKSLPSGAVIERGRRVEGVERGEKGWKVRFGDGGLSYDEFDLVVGCDGVKSEVRKYVCPEEKGPMYSGIQIIFAVAPPRPRNADALEDSTLRQYFGDGGYALQYNAGGPGGEVTDLLAVVYAGDGAVGENTGYAQSDVRAKCAERMRRSGVAEGRAVQVFERADRFVEVGVYYHDALKSWSADGSVVLVGDAAHAMPPFLGAGAGQAIQDAHALALAVAKIGGEHADLGAALKAYQKERQVATNAILQTSRLIGLLETRSGILSKARNALFRVLGLGGITGKIYIASATPTVKLD